MKEVCSVFQLIALDKILYHYRNTLALLPDQSPDEFIADSIEIALKPEPTDAGLMYSFSYDLVVDKTTDEIAEVYEMPVYCLLKIKYTDGSHTIYGSNQYPVVAFIIRGMQRDILNISLQTTDSPLI